MVIQLFFNSTKFDRHATNINWKANGEPIFLTTMAKTPSFEKQRVFFKASL